MAYTVQTKNHAEFTAVNSLNTAVKIVCEDEVATFWYETTAEAGEAYAVRDKVQDLEDYKAAREAFDNLESYLKGVFGPKPWFRRAIVRIETVLDNIGTTKGL